MEPSSVEDGNKCCLRPIGFSQKRLQWSRPQLRTETGHPAEVVPVHAAASMEPSSVEDGNRAGGVFARHSEPLQWSRPQLRTETPW